MIVYFSGTGNSRYCAQMLAAKLEDELIDAFHFIRDGIAAELCSTRPWVFVSPTYGWRIPRIFEKFIRGGSFTGCKTAYFVMTCGSEIGDAASRLRELCGEKGFDFQGVLEVIMPENYVAMFSVPSKAEAAKIIDDAEPVLNAGINAIGGSTCFPQKRSGVVDKLKTAVVNPVFYSLCIDAKPFYVTDACTGCGLCQQRCPLNNIRFNGTPVWGSSCTHCMACICGCPALAIEYGKKSLGKPRYMCREYK